MSRMSDPKLDALWDKLHELGVEDQTLSICTDILGYSTETMEKILYAHTGNRSFDQLEGGDYSEGWHCQNCDSDISDDEYHRTATDEYCESCPELGCDPRTKASGECDCEPGECCD